MYGRTLPAGDPRHRAFFSTIPTQGARPCILGMIYHHPASPKGCRPASRVHASTPPTANSATHATTTQTIPCRRHTTVHPRHNLSSPTTPKRHPTCIECAHHRTLDNEYHRQHHINTDHPMPRTHNRAHSAGIITTQPAPKDADPHPRCKPAHPRRQIAPPTLLRHKPTLTKGTLPCTLGSR